MKIGELARLSGVSERSLRYYEEQGLLSPARSVAGHRTYEPRDVERVAGIQEMFAAGFCSAVIRDLLPEVLDVAAHDASNVAAKFGQARRRLEDEILAIQRELEILDQLQSRLGLAPDVHVNVEDGEHDDEPPTTPAAFDHRDRRLR